MVELLSISAGLIELLALLLLTYKNKYGFLIGIVGNISWVTYVFISRSTYGLLFVCCGAFILNIIGFLRWKNLK